MGTNNKRKGWASLLLFVLFLIALAAVLNGLAWCIGGACDAGADLVLSR